MQSWVVLFQVMYAIVEFIDEGSTAIIPQQWFVNSEEDCCFWPPSRPNELAKKLKQASDSCETHDVRVLGKAGKSDSAI